MKTLVRRTQKEINEIPIPKYLCNTCNKCIQNRCQVFKRYVEPSYNKCFYHSNYSPIIAEFKPPVNLKEIMEQEEKELQKVG